MKDLKYLAAFTVPLTVLLAIVLKGYWSYLAVIYSFVFIPALELILPENNTNYSESELEKKRINKLFDWLLYLNLPIVYSLLFFAFYTVSNENLATYEYVGLFLSVGMMLGSNGINVGHELGHRQLSIDRFIGKLLLLPALYMHFYIEHNFGHHLNVATKEDPATAKYNQTVYSFWVTSIVNQYINAWKIQLNRLKRQEQHFLSIQNDMFWSLIIQSLYLLVVYSIFGSDVLLFAICAAITGFLLLETVNYIEHYGLRRLKTASGRYERVREIHSWNSNHLVGRIVLYELTRHSDHHFKSSKKYQVLECLDESPQMPFGYTTSMALALVPPLWFAIMNKRIPKEMISI